MSERASVFEKPRFGVEATAGAPVAATHVLQSLTVMAQPVLPRESIKASGRKRPVGVTSAKQHTELSVDGPLCYLDLAYLLNSALCAGVVSAGAETGASLTTWLPKSDSADTLQTYTIEMGSSLGSARVPGCFVSDLSMAFSPKEAKMSAKMLGRRYSEGITLTPSPVDVPIVAVEVDTVSIYVSETFAGLNDVGSRLTRCVSANLSLSGRQSMLTTLDDQQSSFSASVERAFSMSAEIVMEENAQGIAMMDRMRQKDIFFVQYEAVGRDIVANAPYLLRVTFPCFVSKTQRSDVDDIFAGSYTLEPCEKTDAFGSGKSGYTLVEMQTATAFATGIGTANTADMGYDQTVVGASQVGG